MVPGVALSRPKHKVPICDRCGRRHVRADGKPCCQKHRKRRDEHGNLQPCKREAMAGRDCCDFHGGKSLRGIASPSFKTGRYSEHLPTRYLKSFDNAMKDPALTSVREELALCDARQAELLARLSTGESGHLWHLANRALGSLRSAIASGNADAQGAAINSLISLVERGSRDEQQWAEVREVSELRRRLAETERRRIESIQAYMTMDEIGAAAAFLAGVLKRSITDESKLKSAAEDISRFFSAWKDEHGTPPVIDALDVEEIAG